MTRALLLMTLSMSVSETCTACRPIDACQQSLSVSDYRGYSYPTSMALTFWCRPAKPKTTLRTSWNSWNLGVRGNHMYSDNSREMHLVGAQRLVKIK